MNKKGIGLGIFLLGIGSMWLLINLGVLSFSILGALFKLWPLIFIVIGINVIFKNNSVVKALAWVGFILAILIYGTYGKPAMPFNFGSHGATVRSDGLMGDINEDMKSSVKYGQLDMNMGAMDLIIESNDNKLIEALSSDKTITHKISYSNSDENVKVNIDGAAVNLFNGKTVAKNYEVSLNKNVIWDVSLDAGATNGKMDFSDVKLKSLEIDAGAVNFDVKLGKEAAVTEIKIDSGASKFTFEIPSDGVGVKVKFDGGLNSSNLDNLGWNKNGTTYESPNYSNAKSKINFDVDMGVGKFDIVLK